MEPHTKILRILHYLEMRNWFEGSGYRKVNWEDGAYSTPSFFFPAIYVNGKLQPDIDLPVPDEEHREIRIQYITTGQIVNYYCYKYCSQTYKPASLNLSECPRFCEKVLKDLVPFFMNKVKEDVINKMILREAQKVFDGKYQRLDVLK